MAQANSHHNTRRGFVTLAAAAATAVLAQPKPAFAAPDDSALVKLEEQIFEQYEGATALDEEIIRLHPIWVGESKRLADEFYDGRSTLTADERWAIVGSMPECRECTRLTDLQASFFTRMDALIKEMFATPAHTAEGRRAKVTVLLGCILGDDWRRTDDEMEYPEQMARNLLIDFIGGEPGKMLRGQFV
jgi:hypothetical protein